MILSKRQDDSGRCWLVKVTCLKKVKIMIVMTLMFAMVGVGVGGNSYGDDDSGIERFHSRGHA